jgi:glycosyltransferase involved in cell wall biosynthesis
MGMAHGLDCLLEAAKTLQNVAPHVTFMLVGEGAEKNQLQAQAQRLHLTNVRFVGQVSRERVPDYIALSDTCLVLLKQREIFQTVIPTKMLEFMSCERPIILGVEGEARRILTQANAGVCIPPENAQALSDAILRLSRDEDLRRALGMNGRAYIERNLSRQRSAGLYLEFLEQLLRPTPNSLAAAA